LIHAAAVIGTCPEVIRMAPVVEVLRCAGADTSQIASGQHRSMSHRALRVFGLDPGFDLDLMRANQSLPDLTSRSVTGISGGLTDLSPDAALVQGDATSVTAGALGKRSKADS
jgi:UDP-N-acetylglucosamine 2-epimerase (non-hydrolysing)